MRILLRPLVISLWISNLLIAVIIGITMVVFWDLTPFASAASISTSSFQTLVFVSSAIPTSTRHPTPVFNPISTHKPTLALCVQSSITPFIIPENTPEVISYSIDGCPLEVYRFGSELIEKMIVAGIHNENEWNDCHG